MNQGLRELAEQGGYTPCEFAMQRLARDAQMLKGWMEILDAGQVPADFMNLGLNDAKALVKKEINDFIKREREWAPFFYPTLKAAEISGEINVKRKPSDFSDDELAAIAAGSGE